MKLLIIILFLTSLIFAQSPFNQYPPITDFTRAYWKFDSTLYSTGTDSISKDIVGGHDLTVGDFDLAGQDTTANPFNTSGLGLEFVAGNTDSMRFTWSSAIAPNDSDWTMELGLRFTTLGTNMHIFHNSDLILKHTAGSFFLTINFSAPQTVIWAPSGDTTAWIVNDYNYIAFVADRDGNLTMYVKNPNFEKTITLDISAYAAENLNTDSDPFIGRNLTVINRFFSGGICFIAIHKQVFTVAQLRTRYFTAAAAATTTDSQFKQYSKRNKFKGF